MIDFTSDVPGAPKAVGPYSIAAAFGNFVFLSGQIGINPETGEMPGGLEEQTRQVLKNLEAVLKHHDLTFSNVMKTTIFLTDMNDYLTVNTIYQEVLAGARPARAAVEVSGLPKAALVEMEMIAVKA